MKLGKIRELTKDLPDTSDVFLEVELGTADEPGLSWEVVDILSRVEDGVTEVFIR